ncbi:DUF5681 domain-containing protein [uncultured Shimia sp.]|jgi:hypothetical protein|uniref:DUF5681 domain-containing protein n=1 Tax=uncultured Shimia sp. TaxID=573152 RepID=UPI00260C9553|nr:DUF5681 domain-containing protein [uncultured Shimia sp.]
MTEEKKPQRSVVGDVGYRKPPNHSRFKKGKSGNPKGRPKGSKNKAPKSLTKMREILIEEAYREVTIQDKSGPVTLPIIQAAIRALAFKAAQGNVSAHKQLMSSLSLAEADARKERLEGFDKAVAYKKAKLADIRAYEARGEEPPMIIPHPDDIEIDYETGEVIYHGPVNEDDLELWRKLHGTIATLAEESRELQKRIDAHVETDGDGEKKDRDNVASGDAVDAEKEDEAIDWISDEIENNRFIIMTAGLSIARRWRLPSNKILMSNPDLIWCGSMHEFRHHLREGTDPIPPKVYKEIEKAKRNGHLY